MTMRSARSVDAANAAPGGTDVVLQRLPRRADGGLAQSARRWTSGPGLPYLLLLPSLLAMAVVIAYPFVTGIGYSLTDGSLLRAGRFVGLANYGHLLAMPDFWNAAGFSLVFALGNVVGCYLLGLGLALLMNQDMPGRGFFRVALLLPWIIPSVVSVISWRWMMADQDAMFNQVIRAFGGDPVFFLSSTGWSRVAVIVIKIWRSFPFMMLSLLAALQGLDRTLYEAAEIDGAGRWAAFRFITLPQISSLSVILCLLMTIWTVNDFDTPFLLTQGGPANATENLVLLAYKYTFVRNNVGVGSAISFVTLIVVTAFIVAMLSRRRAQQ